MKVKRYTIFCILAVVLVFGFLYLTGNAPIVIDTSTETTSVGEIVIGDTVEPFNDLDFSKGDWTAYLYLSLDDRKDRGKLYKCDDRVVIKSLCEPFRFVYNGADMATVNSSFLLYLDEELVFSSGVVWNKKFSGFQSKDFGWATSNHLNKYFNQFERSYAPIVFF